jgi:hypothetical protein
VIKVFSVAASVGTLVQTNHRFGNSTHLVSLFKLAALSRLGLDSGHEVGRLEFGTD